MNPKKSILKSVMELLSLEEDCVSSTETLSVTTIFMTIKIGLHLKVTTSENHGFCD
jgi:hypothetical protein